MNCLVIATFTFIIVQCVTSNFLNKLSAGESETKIGKNCKWTNGTCTPRRGVCGRGLMSTVLDGKNCPRTFKRLPCRVPCVKGLIKRAKKSRRLSPSEAGLLVSPHGVKANLNAEYYDKLKDCRYDKGLWSKCDKQTKSMTRTLTLRQGDDKACKLSKKIIKKMCGKKNGLKKKNKSKKKNESKKRKLNRNMKDECLLRQHPRRCLKRLSRKNSARSLRARKQGCVYIKGEWGKCDAKNLQSRRYVLGTNSPHNHRCPESKIIARRCSPTTVLKTTAITNNTHHTTNSSRAARIEQKCRSHKNPEECRNRSEKKGQNNVKNQERKEKVVCKYIRGDWELCDPTTTMKTRTLTLAPQSDPTCPKKKTTSKLCKRSKLCKYDRGTWQKCGSSLFKTRVDTLKPDSHKACNATRTIQRPCKRRQITTRKVCVYELSDWSECDPESNERNRTKTLVGGQREQCEPVKVVHRSCIKTNGKPRCFFWKLRQI